MRRPDGFAKERPGRWYGKINLLIGKHHLIDPSKIIGRPTLKKATTCLDYDDSVSRGYFVAFIEKISNDEVYVGLNKAFIADALRDVFQTAGLLHALTNGLRARQYSAQHAAVFVWFVKVVISTDSQLQEDRNLEPFVDELKAQAGTSLQKQIHNIFATGPLSSDGQGLESLMALVPLHDNDFPDDFRKIQIVPTIGELNAQSTIESVYRGWMGDPEAASIQLLDRHFRLLREDMLDPLRSEIEEVTKGTGRLRIRFNKPRVSGIEMKGEKCSLLVQFIVPNDILKHISPKDLQSKNDNALRDFFENDGARLLAVETVLLFFSENRLQHFGVVSNRTFDFSIEEISPKDGKPFILTRITVRVAFEKSALPAILKCRREPFADFFVQARATIFSYYPVLKCMQGKPFMCH